MAHASIISVYSAPGPWVAPLNAGPALLPTTTNNFGMEIIADPNSTGPAQILFYNGNDSDAGWGLYLAGGVYDAFFGGVSFFGGALATAGQDTALALVENNGVATFYVNGVAEGSQLDAYPNPPDSDPNSYLLFGESAGGGYTFGGTLSDAEIFTFAPGQFSPSDLETVPEPSTLALGLAGFACFAAWARHRRGLRT